MNQSSIRPLHSHRKILNEIFGYLDVLNGILETEFTRRKRRVQDAALLSFAETKEKLGQLLSDLDDIQKGTQLEHEGIRLFLNVISQNLRQTANVISGVSQMFNKTSLSIEQTNLLNLLNGSMTSIYDILNDLLDYTQLHDHKISIRLHPFDLLSLVEEVTETKQMMMRQSGVHLNLSFDTELPRELVSDQGRIRQIYTHLIEMAIGSISQGIVDVSIKRGDRDGNAHLILTVTANGVDSQPKNDEKNNYVDKLTYEHRSNESTEPSILVGKIIDLLGGRFSLRRLQTTGIRMLVEIPFTERSALRLIDSFSAYSGWRFMFVNGGLNFISHVQKTMQDLSVSYSEFGTVETLIEEALISGNRNKTILFIPFENEGLCKSTMEKIKRIVWVSPPLIVLTGKSENMVSLKDAREMGFTSILTLPLYPSSVLQMLEDVSRHLDRADNRDEPTLSGTDSSEYKNALVVEDNSINAYVLAKLLETYGCRVVVANSGGEAIEKMRQESFNIVFLDCIMPGMDGFETARIIRRDIDDKIPIMAVTANFSEQTRLECMDSGMNDFIPKPMNAAVIEAALERWGGGIAKPNAEAFAKTLVQVKQRLGIPEALYESLVSQFLESYPVWISSIKSESANGNRLKVLTLCNFLRSTLSLFGEERAFISVKQLENDVLKNQWTNVEKSVVFLQNQTEPIFDNLCVFLDHCWHLKGGFGFRKPAINHEERLCVSANHIGDGKSICIIEQEPVIRKLYECMRLSGMKLILFESLEQLLIFIQTFGLDDLGCVILSDTCDILDPLRVYHELYKIDPTLSVVLTSHAPSKSLINEVVVTDIVEVLSKPFPVLRFMEVCENACAETNRKKALRNAQLSARKIGSTQQRLLSTRDLSESDQVDFVSSIPVDEAGGDFFTQFSFGESKLHRVLLLTDVSGHDLEAAFVSAYFNGLIRGAFMVGQQPMLHALNAFNSFLMDEWNQSSKGLSGVEKSVATCALEIDPSQNRISAYLAGSTIPVYRNRHNQVRKFCEKTGTPMGWFDDCLIESSSVEYDRICDLYCWSDGIEDLASSMQVNPLTLVYILNRNANAVDRPEWLMDATDDLLSLRSVVSNESDLGELFYFEELDGSLTTDIDLIQLRWKKSLHLAFPLISEEIAYDIDLCTREALLNAMRHGCGSSSGLRVFHSMLFRHITNEIVVFVEDEGVVFNPHEKIKEIPGYGTHRGMELMKMFSKKCEWRDHPKAVMMTFDYLN